MKKQPWHFWPWKSRKVPEARFTTARIELQKNINAVLDDRSTYTYQEALEAIRELLIEEGV